MTAGPAVDAITVEVVSQRLAGVVQEMQKSLFCTGYSTIIRESRDASCAIVDVDGRVLSQFTVLPLHIGAFPACVESLLQFYPVDDITDGDAFVVNHPYFGGSPHAPDVALLSPIFVAGELLGFSASIAHKSDIGGLVPGSSSGQAREIFHEGIMLPPVRFYRAGVVLREVETILRANSRTPDLVMGDLLGQVGATALGVRRVRDLCDVYGADVLRWSAQEQIRLTEQRVRAAIAGWPDGEYRGSACLHSEGLEGDQPVWVNVLVRIEADTIAFDFARSSDQVRGPYNIRPPLVRAVCSYALKCLVDPLLPANHGLTLAADVVLRPGSVLSPELPAPVNTYMPIANTVAEAIFAALSGPLPRARIAESSRGLSGTLSHMAPGSRYPHVQYELPAGAIGARADRDGVSASKAHVANGTITPVEIIESEFPVEVTQFALVADSGGAGRFRGGLAYLRDYRMLGNGQFSVREGHLLTPPAGRDGGEPGAAGATIVNPGTPEEFVVVAAHGNLRLKAGDVIRRVMTGGGGYGSPKDRDVGRVLDDVRDGYVTPEAARARYGVAVVPHGQTWVVDHARTADLRSGRVRNDDAEGRP